MLKFFQIANFELYFLRYSIKIIYVILGGYKIENDLHSMSN